MNMLNQFKIKSEAEDSYHLEHPNGQTFTVEKKNLSPKALKAIQGLARGGSVRGYDTGGGVKRVPADVDVNDWIPQPSAPQNTPATGAVLENDPTALPPVDPASVPPNPTALPAPNQPGDPTVYSEQDIQNSLGQVPGNNVSTINSDQAPVNAAVTADALAQTPNNQAPATSTGATGSWADDQTKAPPAAAAVPQQPSAAKSSAKAQTDSDLTTELKQDQMNYEDTVRQQVAANDQFQKYMADPKNAVNANRFYQNASTGQKIGIGIAAALAGMGSRGSGKNLALEAVDNAINRDIQTQMAQSSNVTNAYKLNQEALGSQAAAIMQTRAQHLGLAENKMNELLGKAPGPQAQQIAQTLRMQNQAEQQQLAMKISAYKMASGTGGAPVGTEAAHIQKLNALQMIAPELYKDAEKKYIPSVGIARKDPTPEDMKAFTYYDALGSSLQEAKDFAKNTGTTVGAFGVGTQAYNQANSIRSNVVLSLNQLHDMKRLNDREYENYMAQVPDPGAIRTENAVTKLGELQKQLGQHRQALTNTLGVIPFAKSTADTNAIAWARANPGPKADAILKANGAQ